MPTFPIGVQAPHETRTRTQKHAPTLFSYEDKAYMKRGGPLKVTFTWSQQENTVPASVPRPSSCGTSSYGANLAIYIKIRLHFERQIDSEFYLRKTDVYEDFARVISPHEIADESMLPRKKEPFQHACKITG